MNYKELITNAYEEATLASKNVQPEPIWIIRDENSWKMYETVTCWLFGKWAIIIKKRNRKFAQAIQDYCKDHNIYCSYSDYHKWLYCRLCKSHEYERMQEFYYTFVDYLIKQWLKSELFYINVMLD